MKTAALAAIALAFLALTQAPVTIVGDGSEYLCVAHSWLENGAIGNFPCTKLLLVRRVEELSAIKEPGNPIGCLTPNDSRMVFEELASGRRYPTRRGYVNIED